MKKNVFRFVVFFAALCMLGNNPMAYAQDYFPPSESDLIALIDSRVTREHQIRDVLIEGNWAKGSVVEIKDGIFVTGSGSVFLAEWNGTNWSLYFEGTSDFRHMLSKAPDTFFSPEMKVLLDFENSNLSVPILDKTTNSTGYKLPYPIGVNRYVSRAWASGSCPHGSEDPYNAVDFVMPLNSTVVAARGGYVYDVIENRTICGCVNTNLPNWIVIRHIPDDGLSDWYLHIAQNGALVEEGQQVHQGQEIALSHQIGNTCGSTSCAPGTCPASCQPGAHLHFHIRNNSTGQYLYTTFDDVGAILGCHSYTSGNYYDITDPITSASLSGTLGENGYYISNVQATLTATDNLSGVASTYYNHNNASWTPYSSPILINSNGQNTLQYYSVDNVGNIEDVKSTAPFYIDKVPPTNPTEITTGCSIQSDVWQNTCSDLYITWSGASDAVSGLALYQYYWGTDPLGSTGTDTAISLFDPPPVTDGVYYFRIRTKDNAGNWSNWVTLFILRYDGTAPIGSILVMQGWETVTRSSVNIMMNATDSGSGSLQYHIRNQGESWSDWNAYQGTQSWLLPAITGNEYTVELEYKDSAGNVSQGVMDSIYLDVYPDNPASQNYRLIKDTFGFGVTSAQSANYLLNGTISQESASGYSESANFRVISGFWNWLSELSFVISHYLPIITK